MAEFPKIQYIEISEAAKQLNINVATLRRAIKAGKLRAIRLGNGYQVTQQALNAYVQSLEVEVVVVVEVK